MCGLAGYWTSKRMNEPLDVVALRMVNTLIHRGPDDIGAWMDESAGFALAHRRLSILDLSPAGHQPMVSISGRYVIAFNGEIYNHLVLRNELQGSDTCESVLTKWRGHSDTETLLAAFEAWGIEATLKKIVGMFAIALWDRQTKTLTLARDRMGEKPLYYGRVNGALVFSSELKAVRTFPGFNNPIERRALALYMRHNYVPAPWSIYRNIWKLKPGCYVQFNLLAGEIVPDGSGNVRRYWSLRKVVEKGLRKPFRGSDTEAITNLERLLQESLSGQMLADVPVGAFLSGGVDSSTILAMMQAMSDKPVKSFTIGFNESEYNEAENARAVARHLGTDHTEWYVTPQEALEVIPKLPYLFDEPFADSSQIPMHLVSLLARQQVKVSLSGDGGDELFGGYNRYLWTMRLWRRLSIMPLFLRQSVAEIIRAISPTTWSRFYSIIAPLLPEHYRFTLPGDKLHKAATFFSAEQSKDIFLSLISHRGEPEKIVLDVQEPVSSYTDPSAWINHMDFEQNMMYLDSITYLPDNILVKVDRSAMGVSLETRAPFLDHRIVEFVWSLPLSMKIRNAQGKWLLRQVLYQYIPKDIIERPKMGFSVPIDQWLRGPLREWAETLLDEFRLKQDGFIDPVPIRQEWTEHLSERRNRGCHLWSILMFQAWLDASRN